MTLNERRELHDMLPRRVSLSCVLLLWGFILEDKSVTAFEIGFANSCHLAGRQSTSIATLPWKTSARSLSGHHPRRRRRRQRYSQIAESCNLQRPSRAETSVKAAAEDPQDGDDDLTGFFGKRPSTGGYVPSGLTVEEYEKLKKDEALERAKMDYGAWGPRFQRSTRPGGDWFVVPQLWTSGFSASTPSKNPTPASPARNLTQKLQLWIREAMDLGRSWIPPFLLAYMALDTALAAFTILKSTQLTWKQAAAHAITWFVRKQHVVQLWLHVLVAKVVGSLLFTPLSRHYLHTGSRRLLWTQRRLWLVTVVGMISALTVWSFAVAAMRIGLEGLILMFLRICYGSTTV